MAALCSVLCCVRRQQICCPRSVNSNRLTSGQTSEAAELEDGRCYLCNHGPRTHARGEPASELLYSTRDRIQCDELVVIASLTRGHDITISWAFSRSTLEISGVLSATMHRNSVVRFMETLSWPSISHPGCQCHKGASFSALM